jgi:hypothetical protein
MPLGFGYVLDEIRASTCSALVQQNAGEAELRIPAAPKRGFTHPRDCHRLTESGARFKIERC